MSDPHDIEIRHLVGGDRSPTLPQEIQDEIDRRLNPGLPAELTWRDTCLNALRFGIEQTKRPRVVEPIVMPELTEEEFRRLERWSERMAEAICDGEFDT